MNRIRRLEELGQSVWLDHIDHELIASGELERLVWRDGLRGVTSNPTIFQKAIAGSQSYDALLRDAAPSETDEALLERVMVRELTRACDVLRPVYDATGGGDGFASIEVAPSVASDCAGSVEQACRLWAAVARPNLMVKIPGTQAGLPAIESCLAHGININVTLLFSVPRYREVVEAYFKALEGRASRNEPVERIASVASFFVSRVDTKVDEALDALEGERRSAGRALRGKIGIANARLAYAEYERLYTSARWKRLAARGARAQRLLWASTSTKDPEYPDVYYIDALAGPETVDTMTPESFRAYLDHGDPASRLEDGRDRAREQMEALASLGIDFSRVADELEDEGVEKFAKSYDEAVKSIAAKRKRSGAPDPRH